MNKLQLGSEAGASFPAPRQNVTNIDPAVKMTTPGRPSSAKRRRVRLSDARPETSETTISKLSFESSSSPLYNIRPVSTNSLPPLIHRPAPLVSSVNLWSYSNPAAFRLCKKFSGRSTSQSFAHEVPAVRKHYFPVLPSVIKPNEGADVIKSVQRLVIEDVPSQLVESSKPVHTTEQQVPSASLQTEEMCTDGLLSEDWDEIQRPKVVHVSDDEDIAQIQPEHATKESVLFGDVTNLPEPKYKLVRLFIGGSARGTQTERSQLLKNVYPGLRELCQSHGYELQYQDMLWGVSDQTRADVESNQMVPNPVLTDNQQDFDKTSTSTSPKMQFTGAGSKELSTNFMRNPSVNDHSVFDFHLEQLNDFLQATSEPSFMVFLLGDHEEDMISLPRTLTEEEWKVLFLAVKDLDDKRVVRKWYKKDDNSAPPVNVLQAIRNHIERTPENGKDPVEQWLDEKQRLSDILFNAAEDVLGEEEANEKFRTSESCIEIKHAILDNPCKRSNCLTVTKSKSSLPEELESPVKAAIPEENFFEYSAQSDEEGQVDDEAYLTKFCGDVKARLKALITQTLEAEGECDDGDHLYNEVLIHARFLQENLETFFGRENLIQSMTKLLSKPVPELPFVLYAGPGYGKTSFISALVREYKRRFPKAVLIFRFIGLTPESTDLLLLTSLVKQVYLVLKKDPSYIPCTSEKLIEAFWHSLYLLDQWCEEQKTRAVFFLDDIDELDIHFVVKWFQAKTYERVKMVMTICPWIRPRLDGQACFYHNPNISNSRHKQFKKLIPEESHHIEIPGWTEEEAGEALKHWFTQVNRTLLPFQMDLINKQPPFGPQALYVNSPLFWSLRFEVAVRWAAFPTDDSTLEHSSFMLFRDVVLRMEEKYGRSLVTKLAAYLTQGSQHGGLTECELTDILSFDPEVIAELFHGASVNLYRLPGRLIARMLSDLKPYLITTCLDGYKVLQWRHSQFRRFVYTHYHRQVAIHDKIIAKYFMRPPQELKNKAFQQNVPEQPLQFSHGSFNYRQLLMLPRFLALSHQFTHLCEQLYWNFDWIYTKLKAKSLIHVLSDFHFTVSCPEFSVSEDHINLTSQILELSEVALQRDVTTLPGQISGRLCKRLKGEDLPHGLLNLRSQCRNVKLVSYIPQELCLTSVGGKLVRTIDTEMKVEGLVHKNEYSFFLCGHNSTLKHTTHFDDQLYTYNRDVFGKFPRDTWFDQMKLCGRYQDEVLLTAHADGMNSILVLRQSWPEIKLRLKTYKCPILLHSMCNGQKLVVLNGRGGHIFHTLHPRLLDKFTNESPLLSRGYTDVDVIAGIYKFIVFAVRESRVLTVYDVKGRQLTNHEVYPVAEEGQEQLGIVALGVPNDESAVIISNIQGTLEFYSLPGLEKLRTIAGDPENLCLNFQLVDEGKAVLFPSEKHNTLCVWDLEGNRQQFYLNHQQPICHVGAADLKNPIATVDSENVLRVWQLDLEDELDLEKLDIEEGFIWWFVKPYPKNSRYAVLGYEAGNALGTLVLAVYDLVEKETVRSAKLPVEKYQLFLDGDNIDSPQFIDDVRLILPMAQKLFILNLHTMQIEGSLPQISPAGSSVAVVCCQGKAVVTFTDDLKGLQITDISSENSQTIQEESTKGQLEEFYVNPQGTLGVAVTGTSRPKVYVFDLEKRSFLHKVDLKPYVDDPVLQSHPAIWTKSGDHCIFQVSGVIHKEYQKQPSRLMDSFVSFIVWNVSEASVTSVLLDWEHMLEFCVEERPQSAEPARATVLSNGILLCACEDYVIRAFSILTGDLLYRLNGHTDAVKEFHVSPDESWCLTYSDLPSDLGCILWDLKEQKKVAMFIFDEEPESVMSAGQSPDVVFCTKSSPDFKYINLIGADKYIVKPDLLPSVFKDKVLDAVIDPLTVEQCEEVLGKEQPRIEREHTVYSQVDEADREEMAIRWWKENSTLGFLTYEEEEEETERSDKGAVGSRGPPSLGCNVELELEEVDEDAFVFHNGKMVPLKELLKQKARKRVDGVDDNGPEVECVSGHKAGPSLKEQGVEAVEENELASLTKVSQRLQEHHPGVAEENGEGMHEFGDQEVGLEEQTLGAVDDAVCSSQVPQTLLEQNIEVAEEHGEGMQEFGGQKVGLEEQALGAVEDAGCSSQVPQTLLEHHPGVAEENGAGMHEFGGQKVGLEEQTLGAAEDAGCSSQVPQTLLEHHPGVAAENGEGMHEFGGQEVGLEEQTLCAAEDAGCSSQVRQTLNIEVAEDSEDDVSDVKDEGSLDDADDDGAFYFIDGAAVPVKEYNTMMRGEGDGQLHDVSVVEKQSDHDAGDSRNGHVINDDSPVINDDSPAATGANDDDDDDDEEGFYFIDDQPVPVKEYKKRMKAIQSETGSGSDTGDAVVEETGALGDNGNGGLEEEIEKDVGQSSLGSDSEDVC